jgi:hypothetical protein
MRLRYLVLIVAVVTAPLPGGAARADLNYRAEITEAEDSELASLLDKVSELKTLEDKTPASEEALRRRADRDLGRLADAAHSLGYWDADFSYDVDTSGETAKVTVTVKQGGALSRRLGHGACPRREAATDPAGRGKAAAQTRQPGAHCPGRRN